MKQKRRVREQQEQEQEQEHTPAIRTHRAIRGEAFRRKLFQREEKNLHIFYKVLEYWWVKCTQLRLK